MAGGGAGRENRRGIGFWSARIVLGVLLFLALAAGGIRLAAEWRLERGWPERGESLQVQPAAEMAAEGERNYHIFGCYGCHADSGRVLFEAPLIGRVVTPNPARVAAGYNDFELARLIRQGIRKDGTSTVVMPAATLGRMSDADLAAVIAWLRQAPAGPDAIPGGTSWGPLGYVALATAKVPFSAAMAPAFQPPAARPADRQGAYLVGSICLECHALHEARDNGFNLVAPPLAEMAASYEPDAFRQMLHTGVGSGGRDLGIMGEVARDDFSRLTDSEIADIHAYLVSALR